MEELVEVFTHFSQERVQQRFAEYMIEKCRHFIY